MQLTDPRVRSVPATFVQAAGSPTGEQHGSCVKMYRNMKNAFLLNPEPSFSQSQPELYPHLSSSARHSHSCRCVEASSGSAIFSQEEPGINPGLPEPPLFHGWGGS